MSPIDDEVLRTIARVSAVLDTLGVSWAIGGSFSSSLHGEPRTTNDVDFVAALRPEDARPFAAALANGFYVVEETVSEAIRKRGSFNVIDDDTVVKVDVFVPGPGPLGAGQLDRRRRVALADELDVWILSPEDTVLQKLRWYEMGGSVSDRQWRDICDVLRVRARELDREYLTAVARTRGLEASLSRAFAEVGLEE